MRARRPPDEQATGGRRVGLAWFTPGIARWLLILLLSLELCGVGLALSYSGLVPGPRVWDGVQALVMLVVGALVHAMGGRQMADAKDRTGSGEGPPPPAGT